MSGPSWHYGGVHDQDNSGVKPLRFQRVHPHQIFPAANTTPLQGKGKVLSSFCHLDSLFLYFFSPCLGDTFISLSLWNLKTCSEASVLITMPGPQELTYLRRLYWKITMDRGAWRAIVYRVTKSWTQLK